MEAKNDYYGFSARGSAMLDAFVNDCAPSGTRVSWHQGDKGNVQLTNCSDGYSCFQYDPYGPVGEDRFAYTLWIWDWWTEKWLSSTAVVTIYMP
jgi:hypothetical protein